jgi:hypothetical protein
VAEQGLPARDFPWLVPEPAAQPEVTETSDTGPYGGPYEDEPPQMDSGADQGVQAPPDETSQDPGPDTDGSAKPDAADQGPPARWERGAPPPDDADAPPANGDAPPRRSRVYGPYDAAPSSDDDQTPPPHATPDSSADDDTRYRY